MSYEHRCSLLKWQTLEKRREFLSLVQCNNISFTDFFEFAKSVQELLTTTNFTAEARFVIVTNILSLFSLQGNGTIC